ncbi:MAG TPA: phospholipase D-like domain-containing protein [Candidatus Babeliales bacterium]|nr:phospholipase D-like domain-containing protein [Candidatus Babeliales bacterium]
MYKRFFLCFFIAHIYQLHTGSYNDSIELTQSIPEGTEKTFESTEIRNTHDVLIDMINNAKKSINIGMFYFDTKKGESLDDIIKALEKSAQQDVPIKIVADASFYKSNPKSLDQLASHKNFFIRLIDMKKIAGGVMHAKYMIIDEHEIFLGSHNFDWIAFKQVHEVGVRIRNIDLAKTIQAIFNVDWNLSQTIQKFTEQSSSSTKKQKASPLPKIEKKNLFNSVNRNHPVKVTLNQEHITIYPAFSPKFLSYKNVDNEETVITYLMSQAKKNIFVQVMEFSPVTYQKKLYATLENSIKQASLDNVKIQLIFADWSIKYPGFSFVQALSLIPHIEIKISTIPPLEPCLPFSRVEHCKYMVIDDDILWIGTGNWEYSYFYNCRNLGVCIKSKQLNKIARKLFLKDWEGPYVAYLNPLQKYHAPDYECHQIKNKTIAKPLTSEKIPLLLSDSIEQKNP